MYSPCAKLCHYPPGDCVIAKGTNPAVLLVVEARSDDGRAAWHYALTRMTERECFARHNDEDLWTLAPNPSPQTADEPYFNRATR